MDIVADTSAIGAVILNEPDKPAILQKTQGADLFAPLSLSWEIGNALSSLLKRGKLDLTQATAALAQFDQISITLVKVDFIRAITIAHTHNIYAYDAYMIACAQELQLPLLSLDRGLLHAASAAGVSILRVRP